LIFTHQYTATLPCFYESICWSNSEIDKYLSFGLNITGGILVLYSIDSNLGLFKKGNLLTLFTNWAKTFPLIKRKPINIVVEPSRIQVTAHDARVELNKPPESIEELYKYIQNQISLLRKDMKEDRRIREAALNKVTQDWSTRHSKISKDVSEINEQLKAVAIGGIKWQVLGVLLVIYGSYIGLSA